MNDHERVRVMKARNGRWYVLHRFDQINTTGFPTLYLAHTFATVYSRSWEYADREMAALMEPTA